MRANPADVAALLEQMKEAIQNILLLIRTEKGQPPRKDPQPQYQGTSLVTFDDNLVTGQLIECWGRRLH